MSAFGPKQTWVLAPHMSAFGAKADIRYTRYEIAVTSSVRGRSLLIVKNLNSPAGKLVGRASWELVIH
jgi:hypothetical protein